MAYVYFIYAENLYTERNLHLASSAKPKKVAAYLRGKPMLLDSQTRQPLPLGLDLYVDSRGAQAEAWRNVGLALSAKGAGLFRVELAKNQGSRRGR
jgi:hypothetical protein